jgi:hypothetical protein
MLGKYTKPYKNYNPCNGYLFFLYWLYWSNDNGISKIILIDYLINKGKLILI